MVGTRFYSRSQGILQVGMSPFKKRVPDTRDDVTHVSYFKHLVGRENERPGQERKLRLGSQFQAV